MRWTRSTVAAAAVGGTVLLAAGIAHAQGWGGWGQPHRPRASFLIEQFDLDKDGKVTQAEVDQARKDQFAKHDADGDGALSLEEYRALWLEAMRRAMVRQFQANDEDGNASVTVEEFTLRFDDVVADLDRNGDGAVTRDELRPRGGRGPRGAHHPSGPPPGGADGE